MPRRQRYRWYGLFSCLCFVLALVAVSLKKDPSFIVSDGRGYYVYLPSLIIDGDLDFSNQIRQHWGSDFNPAKLSDLTPQGYIRNRYTIGFALTLTPTFLISHALSTLLFTLTGNPLFEANGYTWLYQLLGVATIMGLGCLSMMASDRLLAERFALPSRFIAPSIILASIGSPFIYYFLREPFMVHIVSTFWVTIALLLLHQACLYGRKLGLYAMLGLAIGLALLTRPTNIWIAPFLFYLVIVQRLRLGPTLVAAAALLTPILPQLWIWKRVSGQWLYYSYQSEGFNWGQAALWQTLFSSRHGLFFWSPLLLAPVLGIAFSSQRRRGRGFLGCYLIGFCMLWYLNSSWRDWWFGDAFGARAFTELMSLYALGLAFLAQRASGWSRRQQRLLAATIGLCLLYQGGLFIGYVSHLLPRGSALF